VHENTTEPSVFNSAQILRGLTSWHRETGDARVAEAARRVADWLISVQDQDGSWRRHVYQGTATTYTAHASCWLADAGVHFGDEAYRNAAGRHLRWVLRHVQPQTGWIDLAGFNQVHHTRRVAYTHTIAYALRGILVSSRLLEVDEGVSVVEHAAQRIAATLESAGWLPGVLGSEWTGKARFACVTGTAQMAQIWLSLHAQGGSQDFLVAAVRALDLVKQAQIVGIGGVDIEGAIPGSYPVWGAYVPFAYPNWAAKFFVDAMLAKRRATSGTAADDVAISD
jgi:hypothetical protein